MTNTVLKPSIKFRAKLYLTYILVYMLLVFPWILLGLIPQLGAVYVLLFSLLSFLWLAPTGMLIPAYCRSITYELREEELVGRTAVRPCDVSTKVLVARIETKAWHLSRADHGPVLGRSRRRGQPRAWAHRSHLHVRAIPLGTLAEVLHQVNVPVVSFVHLSVRISEPPV